MTSQKKVVIAIKVDNVIDIITNSSSELFVLKGETKEIVEEMVKNVYDGYLSEYDNIKSIDELTNEELDTFLQYHCSVHMWPAKKSQMPILEGFTFDELYEPKKDFNTGLPEKAAWNGEIQYELRNNFPADPKDKWRHQSFVTDKNRQKVIDSISKSIGNYFLYSLDENPNWDKQEDLMTIGHRYHFG